ncbi:MAG: cobalt/nickel transport system permease protein, partial [Archaeoglobaceae archaeon]|nr:cobalt/nickel transport system permease protein [Archaeoglobaceae archaeon]
MTESLESVQINSKKLIGSNARVWLVLLSLPLIIVDIHAQLIALILFSALSLHASKYFLRLLILPAVFIVFSVAVILFTIDGKEILSLYFLRITDKSLEVALSTLIMLLGYRSIQILLEEVENLKISADARLGFFGFRRRLRTTALMSYMIFLKSMEKVDKFEKAKMARCY